MKTKVASLLVVLVLTATQCMAQKRITVQAQNDDISNNLDLKAVSTAFGESKNLEEFEQKLNDYDSGISNLDLNNDGQVDYLRVIEKKDNDVHVVVIQAVLDKDVYQDVASIVVERDADNNTTVQVIGDPYIYGENYIIEPSYVYTPSIFSFFWGGAYFGWHSPYYWGYYPSYYHHRRPYELNVYMSNVYSHINHNQRYYYTNSIRDSRAQMIHNSIRRNDYATRYPDRTFSNRNVNVRNKREFEFSRSGAVRNNYQGISGGERSVRSYDSNSGIQRSAGTRSYTPSNDNRNNTYQTRSNNSWQSNGSYRNQNNSNTQTYSAPRNAGNSNINPNIQRNNNYQIRQNSDNSNRSNNNVVRESSRSNNTQQVSQPRSSSPQKQAESPRSSESRSSSNSSSRSESRSASGESRR